MKKILSILAVAVSVSVIAGITKAESVYSKNNQALQMPNNK